MYLNARRPTAEAVAAGRGAEDGRLVAVLFKEEKSLGQRNLCRGSKADLGLVAAG